MCPLNTGDCLMQVVFKTGLFSPCLLIHFRLNKLPQLYILNESNFNFRYVRLCDLVFLEKTAKLFANSGDTDQTPRIAASDLGLRCLPVTLLEASRLKWVNYVITKIKRNNQW